MAYDLPKFRVGDVIKVRKGVKSSNEVMLDKVVLAKVTKTTNRFHYNRCPIINIKVIKGSMKSKYGYNYTQSKAAEVYEDSFVLAYQGEPHYSLY